MLAMLMLQGIHISVPIAVVCLLLTQVTVGCLRYRSVAAADVKDIGRHISTRYKYCPSWSHDKEKNGEGERLRGRVKKYQPYVFADDGIPIAIESRYESHEDWGSWKINRYKDPVGFASKRMLYAFTFSLIPLFNGTEAVEREEVWLVDEHGATADFRLYRRQDNAFSFLTPLPLFLYGGVPEMKGCEKGIVKSRHERFFTVSEDKFAREHPEGEEVLAYALAVKLKELEDAGRITDATLQRATYVRSQKSAAIANSVVGQVIPANPSRSVLVATSQIQKPPYKIISLSRDRNSDFAYVFVLELSGEASIQTFFGIQGVFAHEVRNAYKNEFPTADVSTLRIAVQPRLVDGRIEGRAAVLTIAPVSLSYDANTRRGKLSVRFNAGQAEEARAWIRKNIETLARDKNIALTTGNPPPEAIYYSLGEKIEGDVMEIEFKSE